MGSNLDEQKHNYIVDHINSFESTFDSLEFATECEIVIDKDKKESKKQKWKYSKRTVAVSKYRIFMFKKNMFGKGISIEKEYPLLDIKQIIADEQDVVSFRFSGDTLVSIKESCVGQMTKLIRQCIRKITYGISDKYSVKIIDEDKRLQDLDPIGTISPACGFTESYYAYCNYRKINPRIEIIEFIEDLDAEGNKELDFTLCPGIEKISDIHAEIVPIGEALAHNTYFISVVLPDIPNKDALAFASMFMKYNETITKIIIRNAGAEGAPELGEALIENQGHKFQIMDFSGNSLGATCIVPFARSLRSFSHQISVLNLSNCNLSSRSQSALLHAFKGNWGMSLGIQELDLSNNRFDETSISNLSDWLSLMKSHSKLRRLGLSNTNIDVQEILKAIKHFSVLEYLDLSYNEMDKISPTLMEDLIPQSKSLTTINIASTNLSCETLCIWFQYLSSSNIKELNLNIAHNSIGAKNGATLADYLRITHNLKVLNIANNNLGKSCETIISSVQENISVLILDDNFGSLSSNEIQGVTDALANLLLNRKDLKKLSLCGKSKGKLRFDKMESFYEALRNNSTLVELDISDNGIKDVNFSRFCRSLRYNKGLKTLKCDGNGITYSGYQCLYRTMLYNDTLTYWNFPRRDIKNDNRNHEICLTIMKKMNGNGEAVSIHEPFVFFQNWEYPTSTTGLCTIPQYLLEQTTAYEEDQKTVSDDIDSAPTDLPPEPPSESSSEKSKKSKKEPVIPSSPPPPPVSISED